MKNKIMLLKDTAHGEKSVNLEDEFFTRRKIFLVDQIDADSCNETLKQLMYLEEDDCTQEITMYINSPGGDVTSGLALCDYILMMRSPVRMVCTGTAASMAGVIFLCGDKREMLLHSSVMLHAPSFGGGTLAGKKPCEIKELLSDILDVHEDIASLITQRTEMDRAEVDAMLEKDTYFSAKQALKNNICTKIITVLN